MQTNTSSYGPVRGRFGKEFLLCVINKKFYSMGCIWLGCNPYSRAFPVVITQILLFAFVSRIFYFCLKRFGQSTLNCQILVSSLSFSFLQLINSRINLYFRTICCNRRDWY